MNQKKCCYQSQPVQKLPGAAIWSLRPGETDVCVFDIHHPTRSFAKPKAVETSTHAESKKRLESQLVESHGLMRII